MQRTFDERGALNGRREGVQRHIAYQSYEVEETRQCAVDFPRGRLRVARGARMRRSACQGDGVAVERAAERREGGNGCREGRRGNVAVLDRLTRVRHTHAYRRRLDARERPLLTSLGRALWLAKVKVELPN